jgi:hypothetical protein
LTPSHYSAILFGANDAINAAFLHILHLLAAHPAEQAKIRQEIMQVRAARGDGDLVFDWEQIEKMEWLDAVIKESLRMFVWSFLTFTLLNADIGTGILIIGNLQFISPLAGKLVHSVHPQLHLFPAGRKPPLSSLSLTLFPLSLLQVWGLQSHKLLSQKAPTSSLALLPQIVTRNFGGRMQKSGGQSGGLGGRSVM